MGATFRHFISVKRRLLLALLTAFACALCLFGEHLELSAGNFLGSSCREAEAVLRDPETQWMALLCAGAYLVTFSVIRNRRLCCGTASAIGVGFWRAVFLVISALVYFLTYRSASLSMQTVMLLGGAAIGSGAWVNLFWRDDPVASRRSLSRFLMITVVALAIACFWNCGSGPVFSYKHNTRWVGPWFSPNLYVLLMASGIVLATGLAVGRSRRWASSGLTEVRRRLGGSLALPMLLLLAGGGMAVGLWKSYSRGAWVGAGVGGVYLSVQWLRRCWNQSEEPFLSGDRKECAGSGDPAYSIPEGGAYGAVNGRIRTCMNVAVLVCAVGALLFWQYQHTESVTGRRAISASNQNDLSWRNRVAAWEGDLQMMAEKPVFGFGWNQPEPFYGKYYTPSRLDETGAIEMNDYLMLGATLGIPALFCFGMYLWLSFTETALREARPATDLDGRQLDWLKAVCRAGALVLAVGFWFDGGLFKLATSAAFWILLELGRE